MDIELVTNPRADEEFRTHARGLLDQGAQTPEALASALQERYPGVVVRARDIEGERRTVWYVYREGRWVSGQPEKADGEGR
ncbi:MAG: hypothetical protein H0V73_01820 [Chloroflexi bacterium]|nr:hypothetical protein [Chloroflexota bacterium]